MGHESSQFEVVESFQTTKEMQNGRYIALEQELQQGLECIENRERLNECFDATNLSLELRGAEPLELRVFESPEAMSGEIDFLNGFSFLQSESDISLLSKMQDGLSAQQAFGYKYKNLGHATKKAFLRMYFIAPEFTRGLLIEAFRQKNNPNRDLTPEMFVAYQLMSKLVDIYDQDVLNLGGIDKDYLLKVA